MSSSTIIFKGRSGTEYTYWFLNSFEPSAIKDDGGNYVFLKRLSNGNYVPLYFGETNSLRDRLPGHEVWPNAVRHGATDIACHTEPAGASARRAEEADLIAYWNPQLNQQHRTTG